MITIQIKNMFIHKLRKLNINQQSKKLFKTYLGIFLYLVNTNAIKINHII